MPGVPPLDVGAVHLFHFGSLDAAGTLSYPITVPLEPALGGAFVHSQAVQVGPGMSIEVSNPMVHLITN